jgi:hypothetical protein
MALSLVYAFLSLAILLTVFLVVNRLRGLTFALAATVLTFAGMFALFMCMVTLITLQM